MGGEIRLESQVNVGSRFTLHLPLREASSPRAPFGAPVVAPPALHRQLYVWGLQPEAGGHPLLDTPDLAWLPGKLWRQISTAVCGNIPQADEPKIAPCPWSLKVLVVDDVETNRDIICEMLRVLGHETEAASSARGALELGSRKVFDLVLMDVCMPGMDGLQATLRWREPATGMLDPNTPIITLTANAQQPDGTGGRSGIDGCLLKPASLEQLAGAIDRAASMQIVRGIELAPSRMLKKPLLNLTDGEIGRKVFATLTTLHGRLEVSQRAHDREQLLEVLHALKGCAGQAGLDQIHDAAQQQEKRVRGGGWPGDEDIANVKKLIRQPCRAARPSSKCPAGLPTGPVPQRCVHRACASGSNDGFPPS
jgi:two-component system secretion sensor histidine kinase SsrA